MRHKKAGAFRNIAWPSFGQEQRTDNTEDFKTSKGWLLPSDRSLRCTVQLALSEARGVWFAHVSVETRGFLRD